MRLTWLADCLRAEKLTVVESNGWRARGPELTSVNGIVWHHTATGTNWTDERVVNLLVNGRADLPGPLSQLGLDRAGRFHAIASGRANHNGKGKWGNQSIGIEAFNDGQGEPWPQVQLDAYARGTAALCRRLGLNPSTQVLGHKETDPTRKIDPRGIDMAKARGWVAAYLQAPSPTPTTPNVQTIAHYTLNGKPVTLMLIWIPTDANGDGSYPISNYVAHSPAYADRDKYAGAGDKETRLGPLVGARLAENNSVRLVVSRGPANSLVPCLVTTAD